MTVNRKYFRIFLVFLILFGAYQIYEILTIKQPVISKNMIIAFALLIAIIVGSAVWFLRNTKK
ncbi:hypothetical protein [Anaeroselena agilis]|uniref:Uncharacterized protein n=1 Tax=Anaeroselena agilis TaxID=3063788 RepID=A0ABU3P4I6_9FIRM|nr:hypothetical protein [Selenomonadales bacterium 4137-cl]